MERPAPPGVLAIALATLGVHAAAGAGYGMFRDEFYYLACADHMDWGYVDHPPLSIAVLWLSRALFSDSVYAIRLVPAIAGAILVLVAARLAREMGGDDFAQVLAALAVSVTPVYLAIAGSYSMNAFDLLFWAVLALILARLARTDDPKGWLAFGIVAGLGLENKISVLFLGAGAGAALVLTPLRRHLRTAYPWVGGLLAAVLFAPYVLWQTSHGWATLEFMHNAQEYKIAPMTVSQFLKAQVDQALPFNAPLWLAGLLGVFFGRELKRFRVLGIVYATALLLMLVQRAKPYYLAPAYTMLLAAGAIVVGEAISRSGRWSGALRGALLLYVLAGGAVAVPLVVPFLPVEKLIAYERALGDAPRNEERSALGPLPQYYADRFGWEEMTAAVAAAYRSLPPEDRAKALIVTRNYGEAGAITYLGRRYGLPKAFSQHNNFYFWGPPGESAPIVIMVGRPRSDIEGEFERVVESGRFVAPYAMPYETAQPIFLCFGLKTPLQEAWRRGRFFI